jgi:predicted nucleotidyltransferase
LVREKTVVKPARRSIAYDQSRWEILREKREVAKPIMRALDNHSPIVHGSLARGDVHAGSDVDVVIDRPVPSYRVELALRDYTFARREIVQATPWHLIKGQIYIEDDLSVTFPLVKPTPGEEQFYRFGGSLDLESMKKGRRVPGIDKRLMLIEPTEEGHVETNVVGMESRAAKLIGIGLATVKERVDVLTRRDSIGRTGVYLTRALSPDQSFEDVLRFLASRDTNVKRRFRQG